MRANCRTRMSKVDYIRPIEALHGKLKKTDKVGFAKRQKSGTKYTVSRDDWKMHYKSAETMAQAAAMQAKFRAVAALVKTRAQDPSKIDDDRMAFRNQSKDTTFRGFLFATCWAEYEG